MKASHIISFIALVCSFTSVNGAIYQYIFTGTLDSEIPSTQENGIEITAPISGILTLDVTGTGESDLLIPENFATTAADLKLLIGKNVRVSATESKVKGNYTTVSVSEAPIAMASFKPENIVNSAAGSFPATLVVARPEDRSAVQELPLSGLEVSFNANLLGNLKLGEGLEGGISGSFSFGEGDNSQKINFAATSVQRREPEDEVNPRILREWRDLQAHVASIGLTEAIDDVTFQNFDFPDGSGGDGGGGDDPIIVIPEPSALTALIGLFAVLTIVRRKR